MNPFQKWKYASRRRFPWKLVVQLLSIALVTWQVCYTYCIPPQSLPHDHHFTIPLPPVQLLVAAFLNTERVLIFHLGKIPGMCVCCCIRVSLHVEYILSLSFFIVKMHVTIIPIT